MEPAQTPTPRPSSPPPMDSHPPPIIIDDPTSSLWDFADLLDFTSDDHLFPNPWDPPNEPSPTTAPPADPDPNGLPHSPDDPLARTRKRDPRLVCSNFLAGRVPCACPELDEKLEEEGLPGKKRTRTQRAGSSGARCQVPGCEADISELKGYHRRHRVCLQCANAPSVTIDGEAKRYCQQCGKFHIMSDFDEGKRSCRRKLERHNNRRRRKLIASENTTGKEFQQDVNADDVTCEDEDGKEVLSLSSQLGEKEPSLEPEDRRVSPPRSAPEIQTVNNADSVVSFVASQDTQVAGPKDHPKRSLSPSYCDNRSTYSSICPTGRISFKLYDWNPAEFPRRLRLQVFEWLSTMPVELEGYIRPGCTILTMFIAMPKIMWEKLHEDPVSSIHDFVIQPGSVLPARSTFYVYLNNMIFCVLKGGSSVVKVKVEDRAPRLHYVYPMCFEVGTAIEFVACGSNLLQSRSRFLVSFGGKYLACESSLLSQQYGSGDYDHEHDRQLYKIHISHTHPDLFGPAFIEVEHESGLSNFIPVLFGDKEVCSEMRKIQRVKDELFLARNSDFLGTSSPWKTSVQGQIAMSEFLVDLGWLLKEPAAESLHRALSASQIQRATSLLSFLIENESTVILEKVMRILRNLMEEFEVNGGNGDSRRDDIDVLKSRLEFAWHFLRQKLQRIESPLWHKGFSADKSPNVLLSAAEVDQDKEMGGKRNPGPAATSVTFTKRSESMPLLDFEGTESGTLVKKKPSRQIFSPLRSRPALYVVAIAAVCFGVCAVVLHPHKVGEFAVYVHRRLFDTP